MSSRLLGGVGAVCDPALLLALPGFEHETFIFGLSHGIGYIALCLLILLRVKREAPWPLLAASLTPAGPLGTVIGVELIERRGWGIDSTQAKSG